MQQHQILVIEDDAAIRQGIKDALEYEGYAVLESGDGHDGRTKALERHYDLLLLDLVLPQGDGYEILGALRNEKPGQPVIILTARGEESDRVKGLRLGADDYVVKPFSVKELLARVEAVLRRSPERSPEIPILGIAGGEVDLFKSEVRFNDGGRAALSVREVEILRYMARHAGRPISREELLTRVWQLDPRHLETRTVDMHMARLREKLRDRGEANIVIETVRGQGYRLVEARTG